MAPNPGGGQSIFCILPLLYQHQVYFGDPIRDFLHPAILLHAFKRRWDLL
jgi:hypothetical protein